MENLDYYKSVFEILEFISANRNQFSNDFIESLTELDFDKIRMKTLKKIILHK